MYTQDVLHKLCQNLGCGCLHHFEYKSHVNLYQIVGHYAALSILMFIHACN
jgi:hypothetical protein